MIDSSNRADAGTFSAIEAVIRFSLLNNLTDSWHKLTFLS